MDESAQLQRLYSQIRAQYPGSLHWLLDNNRDRLLWQVHTVRMHVPEGGKLVDIGAGAIPFMLMCQKLGYQTTIVDDFGDPTYSDSGMRHVLDLFDSAGIIMMRGDAIAGAADARPMDELSLVTSHDSMEHWHNSPKSMFHKLWSQMRPGALFWLGVPNCVNLRKRISVPFGHGKWSRMADWYEPAVFRGHVREPDTDDLRYIARDLGASKYTVIGRNWLGYRHPSRAIRTITPLIDPLLRPFPGLCSDIYLFAWK